MMSSIKKYNILVIARWPLGGIRTYMKYVYKYLPDYYSITILAIKTQENAALYNDCLDSGSNLLNSYNQKFFLYDIFKLLKSKKFDLIQTHGYISALYVYFINIFFKVPHMLTVHGILEDKYFGGFFSKLKKLLLGIILRHIDIIYSVSFDIQKHLFFSFNKLKNSKNKKVVIQNGIDVDHILHQFMSNLSIRKNYNIPPNKFIFGFLGRFMPQKGFNYLIQAVQMLVDDMQQSNFVIFAVGSGDYLLHYQKEIRIRGLQNHFIFASFQENVGIIYKEVDAIVMPSLWEACPLQPMEALCLGTPLLASNCIGLQEVVSETPVKTISPEDPVALANGMKELLLNPSRDIFQKYISTARNRYDVKKTVQYLDKFLRDYLAY